MYGRPLEPPFARGRDRCRACPHGLVARPCDPQAAWLGGFCLRHHRDCAAPRLGSDLAISAPRERGTATSPGRPRGGGRGGDVQADCWPAGDRGGQLGAPGSGPERDRGTGTGTALAGLLGSRRAGRVLGGARLRDAGGGDGPGMRPDGPGHAAPGASPGRRTAEEPLNAGSAGGPEALGSRGALGDALVRRAAKSPVAVPGCGGRAHRSVTIGAHLPGSGRAALPACLPPSGHTSHMTCRCWRPFGPMRTAGKDAWVSFDVSADAYLRFMGQYSEPLAVGFADLAGVRQGQRVLDVGCGPGALTAELVSRAGADAVSAVEPSASFAEAMRERLPGVDVRLSAAEELPFPDGAFDAAMAQLVVHFMADPVTGPAGDGPGHPSRRGGRGVRVGPRGRTRTADRVLACRARAGSRRPR